MTAPVTCDEFDRAVGELAVGAIGEPRRSGLLAHAAGCARCDAELRGLADVADRLLLLASAAEPPAGFESRVLEQIPLPGRRSRRRVRGTVIAAAAAVVVVGFLIATLIAGTPGRGEHGTVLSAGGARVGDVRLSPDPKPHVLLTIDEPQRGPGERSCELELADGERVVVGRWTYEDVERGVWAVGIDRRLLNAVRMRVLDADGNVIATAELHDV